MDWYGCSSPSQLQVTFVAGSGFAASTTAWVRGNDGNLWLEHADGGGDWTKIPPQRELVASNVIAFCPSGVVPAPEDPQWGVQCVFVLIGPIPGAVLWRLIPDQKGNWPNEYPNMQSMANGVIAFYTPAPEGNVNIGFGFHYVLQGDGTLMQHAIDEHCNWLNAEPIDGNVKGFWPNALEANPATSAATASIYVLGRDGTLWLEFPNALGNWGAPPPPRDRVDDNVFAFWPISDTQAYVLGTDNNLWFASAAADGKWGAIPPHRQQVDGNVLNCWPMSNTVAYILGSDGALWLASADANGQWGQVPPLRQPVDRNVATCWPVSDTVAYVLGKDENLWLESAGANGQWGKVPPPRQLVDRNVAIVLIAEVV